MDASGRDVVLVRFATSDDRDAALARLGALSRGAVGRTGFERIEVPLASDGAVALLRTMRGVLAAEADHPVRIALTPSDPWFQTDPLTGLGQWGLRTATVDRAWDVQRASAVITVAVIDTGIDPTHPELAPALAPGIRILNAPGSTCAAGADERDDNGHGTHVAGIIGALGNNGAGIAGAAFGVRILPIKALDCSGSGHSSDAAEAIVHAADQGARVINLSFGSSSDSQILRAAVEYALSKGAVIVAAVGNCGVTSSRCPVANAMQYPAAYPGVLGVAATDTQDARGSFSNANASVGIAAPGVRIVSTFPRYPVRLVSAQPGYASMSGTSMAAPLVSGVAALLLSQRPTLRPDAVVATLRATADDKGVAGDDLAYGAGRVNAFRALTGAVSVSVPTATPAPTVTPALTATPKPTATPTLTPITTQAPRPTPTLTPIDTPAPTARPSPSVAPTVSPTPTLAPSPSRTPVSAPAGAASALCAAGRTGEPTSAVFLPNVTKTLGGPDGWQTPFVVQDRGDAPTDLEVSFYRFADGECVSRRIIPGLQPGRSHAYSPNDDPALPDDTQYSVVIRSFGAPVVTVVNEHAGSGDGAQALSYDGFTAGSTTAYLPNVLRRTLGFRTPVIVQNVGPRPTTVTARFAPADGGETVTVWRTVAAGRSAVIDPDVEPVLRGGIRYAVTLTSNEPIAVVENVHSATGPSYSVDALAEGAATVYVPYALKDTAAGRVSTIVIQNVGAATVAPTIAFAALNGVGGDWRRLVAPPIAPGASWAFDPRFHLGTTLPCAGASDACLADGEGAIVISAPDGRLVAVVNVVGPGRSMGYTGVTTPSARAYLPNVTRTLGGAAGWTAQLYVQSAGATAATIRWYGFTDGSLVATQRIGFGGPGQAVRVDPRAVSGLSDNAQYSVVVEGIDGAIAAIATQLAAGGDNAMSYEAFPAP